MRDKPAGWDSWVLGKQEEAGAHTSSTLRGSHKVEGYCVKRAEMVLAVEVKLLGGSVSTKVCLSPIPRLLGNSSMVEEGREEASCGEESGSRAGGGAHTQQPKDKSTPGKDLDTQAWILGLLGAEGGKN